MGVMVKNKVARFLWTTEYLRHVETFNDHFTDKYSEQF